jgi:hypothetical protein
MLNHQTLSEALENLPNNSGSISVSAQIARHYAAIDKAMSLGVPQREIIETLKKNGVHINEKSFPTTWARLKKRHAKAAPQSYNRPTDQNKSPDSPPEQQIQRETESTANPSTIDDIIKATPDLNQLAKLSKSKK